MHKLKHIVNGFIWTIVVMYFLVTAIVQIPFVQSWLGAGIGSALGEKLGTRVTVTRVDVGFLNRIIVDGITVDDQSGESMLRASRVAAKIDYYELLRNGHICISSAQLFGLNGTFYRQDAASQPNYKFLIDSLTQKKTDSSKPLELSINSLIIRHGAFTYDQLDAMRTPGVFTSKHISTKDISAHIVIPYYLKDSLVAEVKKLSLKENSGIELRNLSFKAKAGTRGISLTDFEMKLPNTELNIDRLTASYRKNGGTSSGTKELLYNGAVSASVITPSDFAALIPAVRNINTPIHLKTKVSGTTQSVSFHDFYLNADACKLSVSADGFIRNFKSPHWHLNIRHAECEADDVAQILDGTGRINVPKVIRLLGSVDCSGEVSGHGRSMTAKGNIKTDAGALKLNIEKSGQYIKGCINADNVNLKLLTDNNKLGFADADIKAAVALNGNKSTPVFTNVDGLVRRIDYNGYSYRNIKIKGTQSAAGIKGLCSMDDPNGSIVASGTVITENGTYNRITARAELRNIAPAALHLTDKWAEHRFDLDLDAALSLRQWRRMESCSINMRDFSMKSAEDLYSIEKLNVTADRDSISLSNDFGRALLKGRYDMATLPSSIMEVLHAKLPTLFSNSVKPDNDFVVDAELNSTEWLYKLFNIPLKLHSPVTVNAKVNDREQTLSLNCKSKSVEYNDSRYRNMELRAYSQSDTLFLTAHGDKAMDNGHRLSVMLDAAAAEDKIAATVKWNNHRKNLMTGKLCTETKFAQGREGMTDVDVKVLPSEVMVNDTVWNVLPANIKYSSGDLSVDNFAIEHNQQHIRINGLATRSPNDSIIVDLKDVNVNYVLNLINFHSVDFKGIATGTACIKSVFYAPDAYADLNVRDFRFEDGLMGELKAHVNWNKTDKQIDINARAEDSANAVTLINGYVSPPRNHIDLGIEAYNTNMEFLESFCGSFLSDVRARANGKVRLSGPLNDMNLTGQLTADGSVHMKPLNVTYTVKNDTVRFIPDNIIFRSDTIYDRNGNIGIVNGRLHHEHLTHLTYDMTVKADHLLCYDTHSYGDDIFFGTAYGTGLCSIQGGNGRIDIDVDIKPEKNSFIEYNAASPETISGQEFITWNDVTQRPLSADSLHEDSTEVDLSKPAIQNEGFSRLASLPSDMRINFIFNVTPEATLRVLMDSSTGDYIALNGTGSIRASYFNKGSFDMFGTYLIDHGLYKLTIQNIIKKEFNFQQGGTIVFGGDPYNAALNLKAVYTVNGVPLSDLHLGRSFSSNNIRVDCMMNISGTPQSPRVDFDLDLPTVNSDAKQMVKTIINGEEEMNQQVVYLLSVGRFYMQNNNDASQNDQHSQTSLAMQSLLSGTISQQMNSLLGSLVKNNNWSFGANISTGDEGFNNAEYEGLLTGRLLNNRLIINGQFGYRDNANATTSFIGDFDISYLLFPSGNLAIKVYNMTNDRYFTKSSLNTQGIGLMMKKEFNTFGDLFKSSGRRKKSSSLFKSGGTDSRR